MCIFGQIVGARRLFRTDSLVNERSDVMQLKYLVSTFYLHCTPHQQNLPDKRMCSCHRPGNLVYRLHFSYKEMSCTHSVMERTFTI